MKKVCWSLFLLMISGSVMAQPTSPVTVPVPVPDVSASILNTNFACRAQHSQTSCSTCMTGESIELFRVDSTTGAPFVSVCADIAGSEVALIGFTMPFVQGELNPVLKARAFAEPGCVGTRSFDSENSCIVTYTLNTPVVLP